jgi:hypothetical protein
MPVSVEELDATVRAFYEGRGEQVPADLLPLPVFAQLRLLTPMFSLIYSKKLPRLP